MIGAIKKSLKNGRYWFIAYVFYVASARTDEYFLGWMLAGCLVYFGWHKIVEFGLFWKSIYYQWKDDPYYGTAGIVSTILFIVYYEEIFSIFHRPEWLWR